MKGFTLLEVMVALAIMAGVLLTVITSFSHHLSVVSRDRDETVAILLARAKLEELEMPNAQSDKKSDSFAPDHPEMEWLIAEEPLKVGEITLTKRTLTVSWDQKKRSLSLVRYRPPK